LIQSIDSLNQMSLKAIHKLFAHLDPPENSSLTGKFRGMFVGPAWLRQVWGPVLAIGGLGGWWGKEFDSHGNAINLVLRKGRHERRFPMVVVSQVSHLDRKPGLALRYSGDNPFPWPLIVDELRRIDTAMVLGMTLVDIGPFRRMAFPFILQSREAVDEL
jgi:hypothetical protein